MKHNYIATINNETREATMRLYGVIGDKVDGDTFAQELASLDDLELDHIQLRINTPGGNVFQGMSIISAMLSMRTPVHAYVDGVAASMGAIVAISAKKVCMADFAKLMIHDPYFSSIDESTLSEKQLETLESITEMLITVLARRGQSKKNMAKLMSEETWLSADQAKRAGLCDEIIATTNITIKNLSTMQLVSAVDAEYKAPE